MKNSANKIKACSVPDVTTTPVEPGAIVINEADGLMYIGDGSGWRLSAVGVPSQSTILLWLDGVISGNEFVDKSGNDRNFTITGKDWTTGSYFPYKSAATVSAPAGDAVLIAADVNNFLYAAGGTPNEIPIVSFFQNIDYEDKLFSRHVDRVVDGDGVETTEPHMAELVLYSAALTGAALTQANTYFGVPTNDADLVVAPSGGDYDEIDDAIGAASAGQKIIVKSGVYTEPGRGYILLNKDVVVQGVGNVVMNVAGSQVVLAGGTPSGTIKGIVLDAHGVNAYCIYCTTGDSVKVERCLTKGNTNRNIFHRGTDIELTDCVILDSGTTSYSTMEIRDMITLTGCFVGGVLANGQHCIYGNTATFDPVIKYNKFRATMTATSYVCRLTTPFASALVVEHNDFLLNEGIGVIALPATITSGVYDFNFNLVEYTGNDTITHLTLTDGAYDFNAYGNVFYSSRCSSIIFAANGGGDLKAVVIEDNKFIVADSETAIVLIQTATSLEVRNNLFSVLASSDGYGVYMGSPTLDQSFPATIEKNDIFGPFYYDPTGDSGNIHSGIFNWRTDNVETRFNRIQGALLGIVYKADGSFTSTANSIHHNLLIENRITIKGIDDVLVYNNTVSVEKAINILDTDVGKPAQNNVFKNNIVVEMETSPTEDSLVQIDHTDSETGTEFDYNIYHSENLLSIGKDVTHGEMDFTEWQAAGYDANGLDLNTGLFGILFKNLVTGDYSLKNGSPAIGAGEDLGAGFDYGLDETTVWGDDETLSVVVTKQQPTNWDVGAYVK